MSAVVEVLFLKQKMATLWPELNRETFEKKKSTYHIKYANSIYWVDLLSAASQKG